MSWFDHSEKGYKSPVRKQKSGQYDLVCFPLSKRLSTGLSKLPKQSVSHSIKTWTLRDEMSVFFLLEAQTKATASLRLCWSEFKHLLWAFWPIIKKYANRYTYLMLHLLPNPLVGNQVRETLGMAFIAVLSRQQNVYLCFLI